MRQVAMSRSIRIKGSARINGTSSVPGDKSIARRVTMLASIANGPSTISGFASSADCHSTLDCIRRLGIKIEERDSGLVIHGRGLFGYQPPESPVQLDAGNSGSTIRMLSGILAGQGFTSRITGDSSLTRRPMARIIEPLIMMGARVEGTDGSFAPLTIQGGRLKGISYKTPVASAQVKSCVLFAGLLAEGHTTISEPADSRNHTELMLKELGAAPHRLSPQTISIEGLHELRPVHYRVPGDVSSAAFLVAAASVLSDSKLFLRDIGLNPTRTAFLDTLKKLGASISTLNVTERHGEMIGDISVSGSRLAVDGNGLVLAGPIIPNII